MAHDGFLGAFPHELPWQLAHAAAAAVSAPLDSLHVQAPHPLVASGWDHNDAAMSSSAPVLAAHEAALMEQLVVASRLGAPSPPSSLYASCYSSPPSKPDFGERAARLSCLAAASGGGGGGNNLSRVPSSQSLLAEPAASPRVVNPSDGSSSDGPSRKRKAAAAAGGKSSNKAKETAVTTATAKKSPEPERRSKKSKLSMDSSGEDDEPSKPATGNAGKGKEVVVVEPPKDYIHVRARRGQATDSHSLAERVRREKISERMKLLQDIVPGCSKVTGKAVMLDEIINYVQSLQRQVEFLSMKLSTVNPRLDVDVDSFVQKDANLSCAPAPASLPPPVYSMEGSNSPFGYASSAAPAVPSAVASAKSFERTSSFVSHGNMPDQPLEGFQNANPHQIERPWEEDDLQSLVQMGFRGNT